MNALCTKNTIAFKLTEIFTALYCTGDSMSNLLFALNEQIRLICLHNHC